MREEKSKIPESNEFDGIELLVEELLGFPNRAESSWTDLRNALNVRQIRKNKLRNRNWNEISSRDNTTRHTVRNREHNPIHHSKTNSIQVHWWKNRFSCLRTSYLKCMTCCLHDQLRVGEYYCYVAHLDPSFILQIKNSKNSLIAILINWLIPNPFALHNLSRR